MDEFTYREKLNYQRYFFVATKTLLLTVGCCASAGILLFALEGSLLIVYSGPTTVTIATFFILIVVLAIARHIIFCLCCDWQLKNRQTAFLIGIFLPVLYLSLSAAAFGIAEGNGVKSEINATVLAKCSSSNRDGIAQLQMECSCCAQCDGLRCTSEMTQLCSDVLLRRLRIGMAIGFGFNLMNFVYDWRNRYGSNMSTGTDVVDRDILTPLPSAHRNAGIQCSIVTAIAGPSHLSSCPCEQHLHNVTQQEPCPLTCAQTTANKNSRAEDEILQLSLKRRWTSVTHKAFSSGTWKVHTDRALGVNSSSSPTSHSSNSSPPVWPGQTHSTEWDRAQLRLVFTNANEQSTNDKVESATDEDGSQSTDVATETEQQCAAKEQNTEPISIPSVEYSHHLLFLQAMKSFHTSQCTCIKDCPAEQP